MIAQNICRSHLDPLGGRYLAAVEARRLQRWLAACRVKKEDVRFLTLTYDPKQYGDPYDPTLPEAIWEDCRANKHVSRFMSRVEAQIGRSLQGCWRVKAEFHVNGILHFHLLVRSLGYIKHCILQDLWGHGFVYIQRASRRHAEYIAKYQSKSGGYPDFLYDKPRRSVKIWGTSPGFWSIVDEVESVVSQESGPSVNSLATPKARSVRLRLGNGKRDYDPDETIGSAIERSRRTIVGVNPCTGVRTEYSADLGTVVMLLSYTGCDLVGTKWGWHTFTGHMQDLEDAVKCGRMLAMAKSGDLAAINELGKLLGEAERASRSERGGALHLIGSQDRDYHESQQQTKQWRCGIPIEDWPDDVAPF